MARKDDKNKNKIFRLEIHQLKLHKMSISVDGTAV